MLCRMKTRLGSATEALRIGVFSEEGDGGERLDGGELIMGRH